MTERIAKVFDVWVAWSNTDLIEGRGLEIPYAVCLSETTALRMGEKKSVQGSNCRVTKEIAVEIEGQARRLYGPTRVHHPSQEDKKHDKRIARKRAAIERAKELGMTAEEIAAITTVSEAQETD